MMSKEVLTPDGRGTVAEIAVIREKIRVRISVKDGVTEFREYNFDEVQLAPKDGSPVQLPAPTSAVAPEAEEEAPVITEPAAEISDEEIAAVAALMDEPAAQPKSDRPRSRGGRGRGGRGRRENAGEESAENGQPRETREKREGERREKREPRENQPRENKDNRPEGNKERSQNGNNRPPRPPRPPKPQQPKTEGQQPEQPKADSPKPEGQGQNRSRSRRGNRPRRNSGDPNAVHTIPKEQRDSQQ